MIKYHLINSDVYAGLISLEEKSIDIVITSPPYWNQRDYGFEGQIGTEKNPIEYIFKLTKIFNVLKNKLKPNGVFFLNIGDKYLSKYGKTPLGFIPYKLAYEMINNGWFLNDIIIWYKPNHMPSSVKNRFVNSYEPIFVFSPTKDNIFNNLIKSNKNYTNILKVSLQPTPYEHIAVFPEQLVKELLNLLALDTPFSILDPFAGSGTTLKVVKEKYPNASVYLIELNKNYIDIIKKRCNLKDSFIIKQYDYVTPESEKILLPFKNKKYFQLSSLFKIKEEKILNKKLKGLIKITKNKKNYYKYLEKFENSSIKNKLTKDCLCFLGSEEFDLDLIIHTSNLNELGWVIRNLIVVQKNNKWFPIFMIVDDNKCVDYLFNYKNLNLKSSKKPATNEKNFIGYHVVDNINKEKKEGTIVDILEKYEDNFPKYVLVKWNNEKYTKEFVINNEIDVNSNIKIKNLHPLLIEEEIPYVSLNDKKLTITNCNFYSNITENVKKESKSKFKNEIRKNWGSSPGVRLSLMNEYFSLQRLYDIDQKIISNYLNYKIKEKNLTKSQFINLFPKSYFHTINHWLRSDFGGSIPLPEDWKKIEKILDIDNSVTKYVCSTALKLQTVSILQYKLPEDFISYSFISKLKKLYQ